MEIVIAHPKTSYIDALKQMLQGQDINYNLFRAGNLSEFVEKISINSYDLILVDSDLAANNQEAFLKILDTIKHESRIILSARENEDDLIFKANTIGIQDCVLKKSGYLLSLTKAVKRAVHGFKEEKSSLHLSKIKRESQSKFFEKEKDKGYFVCDRRGRFLSANNVLEEITKYSNEELIQLSMVDLIAENQNDSFLKKLFDTALHKPQGSIITQLVDKFGDRHLCSILLRVLRDDSQKGQIIGFRGTIKPADSAQKEKAMLKYRVDQSKMIAQFVNLVQNTYSEPFDIFLRRIAQVVCQVFKFKRSTIALLDRRKQSYIKQAMVGYTQIEGQSIEERALEVPCEVIDRIFVDRFRIKVIYYNQDQREIPHDDNPGVPERRTQRRRPLNQWHKRDLVLLNLQDHTGNTFGYLSLDDPHQGILPTRSTFYNLELFSQLISMSIENYYRFNVLMKKNRRLKQMLANSNIFKLDISLTELLNEIVWSAKYTLDFNIISLLLISKKTKQLETKAVACEDRIKQVQIRELIFDIEEFSDLLTDEYRVEKSYLINKQEEALKHYKQIYYGSDAHIHLADGWPNWGVLLVPIKAKDKKIIGFFMADDPYDRKVPSIDSIHTLEILANQVAVAIDNRILYVQSKEGEKVQHFHAEHTESREIEMTPENFYRQEIDEDLSKSGFKKLVERFLR